MAGMESAFALVVGVANYSNIKLLPPSVLQDARDVRDALTDPSIGGYRAENVRLLLDEEADGDALRRAFDDLAGRGELAVNEDSTVIVYISSHGGRIESGSRVGDYLLPFDADPADAETLARTSISGEEFAAYFAAIPARKVVVIFDCCHAGGIGEPKDSSAPSFKEGLPDFFYERLKTGRGRVILASSRGDESSFINQGARNSLFTEHLLAGLRGGVSGAGGVVRVFDLFDYIQPRVTSSQPRQHPVFKAVLEENFPIALYLGGEAAERKEPLPDDGFVYDVFVSYRHREPDKSWVRKTLVPALRADGLRVCLDVDSFEIGSFVVKEMERAVEQSRYTVAILSPRYIESGFADFEQTLAQHVELEERRKRYLGVMIEPCEPSLSIRARFWLEMTDEDEFRVNLPRLAEQIRQKP
jgi:hypothetical protein